MRKIFFISFSLMSKNREFDMTRKLQDEEYEAALRIDSKKLKIMHIAETITKKQKSSQMDETTAKKQKILEAPPLLSNPNIRLKIRVFSGKIISCSFNENECIQVVIRQLQWLFHSIESFHLHYNGKLLPMSNSLQQCGILDQTTIIADSYL